MLRTFAYRLCIGLLLFPAGREGVQAQQTFSDSLRQVADRIGTRVMDLGKPRVALAGFTDPGGKLEPALITYVEEVLLMHLTAVPGIIVVERRGLDHVLQEQRRSASGTFDEGSAIELGRLLTADVILTGSIYKVDKRMHLILRMLDTGTGILIGSTETFTEFPKGKEPADQKARPEPIATQRPAAASAEGHLELRATALGYSFHDRNIGGAQLETSFRSLGEGGVGRGSVSIGLQMSYFPSIGRWRELPFRIGHVNELRVRGASYQEPTVRLGSYDLRKNDLFLLGNMGAPLSYQPMSSSGLSGTELLELHIYSLSNVRMDMAGFNIPLRWYLGKGRFRLPRLYMEMGAGMDLVLVNADYEVSTMLLEYDFVEGEYTGRASTFTANKPLGGGVSRNIFLTHMSFGGGLEAGRFSFFVQGRYLLSSRFSDIGQGYNRVRGNILAAPVLGGAATDAFTLSDLQRDGVVPYGAMDLEKVNTGEQDLTVSTTTGNGVYRFWDDGHLLIGLAFRFW